MGFDMELVLLTKAAPLRSARNRRSGKSGVEVIERLCEDGELARIVDRVGAERLPTLARLDPYRDHVLDAYWCGLLRLDLERIDSQGLTSSEAAVVEQLAGWAARCEESDEFRVRLIGD
jgi:hypothetical protein